MAAYKFREAWPCIAEPTSLLALTALEECAGCPQGMPARLPIRTKPPSPPFIQTHSSCLANYLGQRVPSASWVLCPRWERGILCGERILLRLHMTRASLQACILIPFLWKGPAGGEWEERKEQNSLGHLFLLHTLKPRWQGLKAEGAKSHPREPVSLDKQAGRTPWWDLHWEWKILDMSSASEELCTLALKEFPCLF